MGKVGSVAKKTSKANPAEEQAEEPEEDEGEKDPIAPIDPIDLALDIHNPRFAAYHPSGRRKEDDVIAHLLENDDLMELVESIASNGYIDLEPLIVLDEKGDETLTVVEGNRRAAALKLLRNADKAAKLSVKLPAITEEVEKTLHGVTVRRVESRDEARQLIGFIH